MLRKVLEHLGPENQLVGRFARPHGVADLEGDPAQRPVEHAEERAHRHRVIGPEAVAQRREGEAIIAGLGEDPGGGQEAQHPVQRSGMGSAEPGQFLGRPRAVGEVVGEAELGRDRHRAGDDVLGGQIEQLQRRSGASTGRCGERGDRHTAEPTTPFRTGSSGR